MNIKVDELQAATEFKMYKQIPRLFDHVNDICYGILE